MDAKELVRDIKDKIQFLVTIEIFFSTLIYGFFKAIGSTEVISNSNASIWAVGVATCVINYIIIQYIHWEKALAWIRRLIYTNLIFFAPLLVLTTLVQQKPLPDYFYWPFLISLWGSTLMPFVALLVIIVAFSFQPIKKTP